MIIAFEGIDKSGKTTQARLLARTLDCDYYAMPTRGPAGRAAMQLLRQAAQDPTKRGFQTAVLAFAADFAYFKHNVQPAGQTITIMDRYVMSFKAYAAAYGCSGIMEEAMAQLDLPRPELTFVLDCNPADVDARRADDVPLGSEVLDCVAANYRNYAASDPRVHVIPATGTRPLIHMEVMNILREELPDVIGGAK